MPDPLQVDELAHGLAELAGRVGVPLVVGAAQTEKFATRTFTGELALRVRETHNAAHLVLPAGGHTLGEPYRKRRLVPFAEYLPLQGNVAWPAWLVAPMHTPLQAGLDTPPHWSLPDGTRIAALICWENLFAGLARDAVGDGAPGPRAAHERRVVRSAAPPRANTTSRRCCVLWKTACRSSLRRMPGRRRSSTRTAGWSARRSATFESGVVTGAVAAGDAGSFYSRTGDWLVGVAVLLVVVAGVRRAASRPA